MGDIFDIVLMPVADGLAGFSGMELSKEVFVDLHTNKLYKVVTREDVFKELDQFNEANAETIAEGIAAEVTTTQNT